MKCDVSLFSSALDGERVENVALLATFAAVASADSSPMVACASLADLI